VKVLCLRSDKQEAELYLYEDQTLVDSCIWQAHRELAETLYFRIDEVLKRNSLQLQDIEGIVSYSGPGSFTGLRIGISATNALAYALNVPHVGEKGGNWQKDGIEQLKSTHKQIVLPEYGGEVYITEQKK